MSILHRCGALVKLLFRRGQAEAELDDEVREFYRTMVDREISRGVPEREARRLARLRFDSPEQVKERVRDARAGAAIASLGRDLAYALRSLAKGRPSRRRRC